MTTATEILQATRDLLQDESCWLKDLYCDGRGGYCLRGAWGVAAIRCPSAPEVKLSYAILSRSANQQHKHPHVELGVPCANRIVAFNDCPETTFAEVVEVLDRAIARSQEVPQ